MPRKTSGNRQTKKDARASVSFPSDIYDDLAKLAAAKKVSLAWVVREAAAKYIADNPPTTASTKSGDR